MPKEMNFLVFEEITRARRSCMKRINKKKQCLTNRKCVAAVNYSFVLIIKNIQSKFKDPFFTIKNITIGNQIDVFDISGKTFYFKQIHNVSTDKRNSDP